MLLEPGAIVGDYRVIGSLGAGGMGQVYKVQNLISNRTEAMKILLPDMDAQPQLMERFLREIQVQASLVHPNIASLHTASRQENRLLMFMELVEGETLASRLAGGPLPVAQAVNITTQILNALAYAHERGVVHRDIKPSNIMLATDGVAKLLDFGLAAARGDKRLTMTGNLLGSLHYMSPEQVRGAPPTAICDIYSLGLTLYEMLTGRRGIEGTSDYEVMTAHLLSMPEPPGRVNPSVPAALGEIVLTAVAKTSSARFGSALEFKAALDRYRQSPTVPTPAPARVETAALAVQPGPSQSPMLSTWTPSPPAMAPVQPMPDYSLPAPMQSVVQAPPERVTLAPRREARRPSRVLMGTAVGAAVVLIGGGLMYWSRGTHQPPLPRAANQPTPQVPAEPPPSQSPSAQPLPSQPVAARPAPAAPAVSVQPRPPRQKPAEKPLPSQPKTNEVPPSLPVVAPASTTASTGTSLPVAAEPQPVAVQPQPAATAPQPPAKTAQQLLAEEWARVSSSRDPAAVQQFLAAHSDSPFTAQAETLLADLTWDSYGRLDPKLLTPDLMRKFAARFPASGHAPEALRFAARLETQTAVGGVVSRFRNAFSARDLNTVRELWPSANPGTIGRISELFKKSRTVTLTLLPKGEPILRSEQAEVAYQESLSFLDGSTTRTTNSTLHIRLVKSGGAWIIESIVTSGAPSLYNPF